MFAVCSINFVICFIYGLASHRLKHLKQGLLALRAVANNIMPKCTLLPAWHHHAAVYWLDGESGGAMSRRHTTRFLVIWLFFLPLTLWPTARWTTVPATAIIAFLLLGDALAPTHPQLLACDRLSSRAMRFHACTFAAWADLTRCVWRGRH